jgi:NAD(P)-dependent dehydrogenase (short-subunit alcohol dehydrogenase family)
VWQTTKAATPYLIDHGTGGSMVLTCSTAGHRGTPHAAAYTASKHAVVGLMRTQALGLAPHYIRVNTVHSTGASIPMLLNDRLYRLVHPKLESPTQGACGGGHPSDECSASQLSRTDRRVQCCALLRFGRSSIRDRYRVAGRRRLHDPLTTRSSRTRPNQLSLAVGSDVRAVLPVAGGRPS